MAFDFSQHTAIFGGSFNPPHLGHVEAVKGLFQEPKPARVWVLPSFGTPLKETAAPFEDRLEMTRLAFKPLQQEYPVEVSDLENRIQSRFTWQVLQELQSEIQKIAFVMGTDQLEQLEKWARFPDFLGLADWIVLVRKPKTMEDLGSLLQRYVTLGLLVPAGDDLNYKWLNQTHLRLVHTPARELCASELRGYFALGKTEKIKPLLPHGVYDYLEGKKMYGT